MISFAYYIKPAKIIKPLNNLLVIKRFFIKKF